MNNFDYCNPTRILFGKGQIEKVNELIPADCNILLVAGGGSIKNNGVYDRVKLALANRHLEEFWGVEPNPDFTTLMRAVEVVKRERINFLIAVGGGSVADGTKFIAAAARSSHDPWQLLLNQLPITEAIPVGVILTLPATGSESNPTSVISHRATGQKLIFSKPECYPKFAILEPETTYSLPPNQVANGVADAFVHIIEQYLTYPVGADVQDRLAEGLMLTLIDQGPKALTKPDDYDVRANVMLAATLALNGLIGQGVPQDWSTHLIGHELTALYGIDHARSLTAVLPGLMRVRQQQKGEKIRQLGARVFGITQGSSEARTEATIEKLNKFFASLGTPTRLSACGLGVDAIPKVVTNLRNRGLTAIGERGDITPETVTAILTAAI